MEEDHKVILQMTLYDYNNTLSMIQRIMRMRETKRKKIVTTGAKRRPRKQAPTLNLISTVNDLVTVSMSKTDHEELKYIIKMIINTRERNRDCGRRKREQEKSKLNKVPEFIIIKS